jgi:hypothetical protein
MTVVPGYIRGAPVAECTFDHPDGSIVCLDIFTKRVHRHRLHRGNMTGNFRSPYTEPADIGADIKDPVFRPEIIEAVLGHPGYLAI